MATPEARIAEALVPEFQKHRAEGEASHLKETLG